MRRQSMGRRLWMRESLMTETERELIERSKRTSRERRRGMWLWFLVVGVVAAAVVLAVVLS
jgi:predicted nucleic acid-binding Zn ribbon protein